jgi:hypothetical protein
MALTPEQQALDFNPELQDVTRQRKLADMLMAKGFDQPQGQMISGYYVAPSFTQQINPMANVLAGQAVGERADAKQAQMAQLLRTQGDAAAQDVMDAYKQSPQLALQKASQYQQYPQVKALLPQLSKVALPEATTLEREYAAAKGDPNNPFKGSFNDFKNQMNEFQKIEAANSQARLGLEGSRLGLENQKFGLEQQKFAYETQNGKPLTESQGKAASFGGGALEGNNIMSKMEKNGFDPSTFANQSQITLARNGAIGNMAASPNAQKYQNAMDLFGNNYLRYQSGANMPIKEIQENLALMTPRIGDSKAKLQQKENARLVAIKGMESSAGPAGTRQMHENVTQEKKSNVLKNGSSNSAKIDPILFQYMTPEQQALFGNK